MSTNYAGAYAAIVATASKYTLGIGGLLREQMHFAIESAGTIDYKPSDLIVKVARLYTSFCYINSVLPIE
jgi:hypothetical protein